MRVGIGVPQLGHVAEPTVTREIAVLAEQASLDSLWAIHRLLVPTAPRSTYPSADLVVPAAARSALWCGRGTHDLPHPHPPRHRRTR
jgi:hypothetical protein